MKGPRAAINPPAACNPSLGPSACPPGSAVLARKRNAPLADALGDDASAARDQARASAPPAALGPASAALPSPVVAAALGAAAPDRAVATPPPSDASSAGAGSALGGGGAASLDEGPTSARVLMGAVPSKDSQIILRRLTTNLRPLVLEWADLGCSYQTSHGTKIVLAVRQGVPSGLTAGPTAAGVHAHTYMCR
jgi:hypothetical protein